MKRTFDIMLSILACLVLGIPMLIIALIIHWTSKGQVLHWSERIGRYNEIFFMPKFRTMRIDTPQVATHLLSDPDQWITPIGRFLRKHSLDELPQLWNILKGDMSFVGPRPALFNQEDLIDLRTKEGIHQIVPGLTGLAQIKGRDHLTIPEKVEWDKEYLRCRSFWFDLKILFFTFFKVAKKEGIRH
ncbi:MAG: sugar transferase [Candidatus Aureabacteria bacterium]|nr:sugar transferase [Candidatus Auribacterota bacterium]